MVEIVIDYGLNLLEHKVEHLGIYLAQYILYEILKRQYLSLVDEQLKTDDDFEQILKRKE